MASSQQPSSSVLPKINKSTNCSLCFLICPNKSKLNEHIRSVHLQIQTPPTTPTTFNSNGTQDTSKGNKHNHILDVVGEPKFQFQCSKCPSKFSNSKDLKSHKLVNTDESSETEDVHITTLAEEKTHSEQDMARLKKKKRTKRKKTKKKVYSCYFCSKIFYQFFNLNSHMRLHTMETPFKCQFCRQMFKRKTALDLHKISVHTKKYPFKCFECDKVFARKWNLTNHGSVHTGEKRYFCKICSYSSYYKDVVDRHQIRPHNQTEKSWKCMKCSKLFRTKRYLRQHQIHTKCLRVN